MDRDRVVNELESSLEATKSTGKKMRLHYLLAKFCFALGSCDQALYHFYTSVDLLEYVGKNGLMGFRDFYRYRGKLEFLESFAETYY
jgi:hypothetical protein